jgi:ABC-type enterochelin transport system substrate-binding protein
MTLPLADKSGLSRNCAEAVGLPPATLKHKKGKHDKLIVSEQVKRPNPCMMMMIYQ